jgi:hypothetical protein
VIFPEAAEGREFKAQLSLTWRPSPSVRIIGTLAHDRITRTRDGRESALANIPHLELDYQLSRALFIRYIGQYVAQRQAPLEDPRTGQPLLVSNGTPGRYSAVGAVASNLFRSDFLFSYKPTPGTVLFLGYGASLTEPEALALSAARLRRIGDGWFFKGSYLYSL